MAGVKKKGSIGEEDVSLLLQRYNATTILALLQEVSQMSTGKIDWNALVKSTSTGISNAREYQMLWRHLAYRDTLLEKLEDEAEPLDDDSDLEFELEAIPAASDEALSEATACAKVLLCSGSPRDSGPATRCIIEAPLTIHTPNDQLSSVPSDKQQPARTVRGVNSMFSTPVQKQPLPSGPSTEVLDGIGSAASSLPAKKKRKLWTKEEDIELIAAVQKCGEGNWANILKGDFKHNRTASQLSQRWAIIRRRQATNWNVGSGNKTSSSTRSEERLAAQKAFSLAVDMPMAGSISAIFSGGTQPASSSAFSAPVSEVSVPPALNQCQQASNQATTQKVVPNPSNKSRTIPRKPAAAAAAAAPLKPSVCPNPLIQAAAFAAGGRIANPSTAASLFKAAQSKTAVHIRPGGGSLPKSSVSGSKLPSTSNPVGPQTAPKFQQVRSPVSSSPTLAAPRLDRTSSLPSATSPSATNRSTQETSSESKDSQENGDKKSDTVISAIDVDELLSEEVGGGNEMELDDAVAQDDQSESQIAAKEAGSSENEVLENEVAVVDADGTRVSSASSLKDSGSGDNGNVDEEQADCVGLVVVDEVKESKSENIAEGSNSPVDDH